MLIFNYFNFFGFKTIFWDILVLKVKNCFMLLIIKAKGILKKFVN